MEYIFHLKEDCKITVDQSTKTLQKTLE